MLRELHSRPDDDLRRRHFVDEWLELFVWIDNLDRVVAFQLCYDLARAEKAVTWRETGGWEHASIDSGEDSAVRKRSPIAVSLHVDIPFSLILREWEARSVNVDRVIVETIRAQLQARLLAT